MYFDAVLDDNMAPLFNGTAEATREWLLSNPDTATDRTVAVCIGKTMRTVSVSEYLRQGK